MNGEMGSATAGTTATTTTTGPRAKCDQVIFEALSKASEIIVASRGGGSNSGGGGSVGNNQPFHFPSSSGAAATSSAASGRFNLIMPENPTLRSILQRWRRALHLPIRLDVYYEHGDQRRELLERWCLGYVIGDAFWRDQQQHNAALLLHGSSTADPIVQLRHVCKKIVIWLRTLHCFARMLPSTAFLHHAAAQSSTSSSSSGVGFSLYAVSEDTDDVSQLQEQGFLYQRQPSTAVTTPYGELSWQVLYAPGKAVQRLVPRAKATFLQPTTRTSQAIPIVPQNHREPAQHRADHFEKKGTANRRTIMPQQQGGMMPQTAPAHMNHYLLNDTASTEQQQQRVFDHRTSAAAALPQQNTYNPSFFTTGTRERHSSVDDVTRQQLQQQQQMQQQQQQAQNAWPLPSHGLLQRRHTSIGQEHNDEYDNPHHHHSSSSPRTNKPAVPGVATGQPERVLSGLSLALLMSDNTKNRGEEMSGITTQDDGGGGVYETNDAAAEKRRAALHQMPPHLQQQQQQQQQQTLHVNRATSNEYGYAYNNHIPRQKSSAGGPGSPYAAAAASPFSRDYLSSSPTFLGSTPPTSGLFLGGANSTPPPPSTTSSSLAYLLPPRNSTTTLAATPPFAPRPAGFIQDHPPLVAVASPPLPPQSVPRNNNNNNNNKSSSQQQQASVEPPLTSLDMLHHSPFLHAAGGGGHHHHHGGSMIASLSSGGGGGFFGSEAASLFYNSADLRKSGLVIAAQASMMDEYEEMPFAVDSLPSSNNNSGDNSNNNTASHILASSAAVASFAQKCSVHQRLELFDRQQQQQQKHGHRTAEQQQAAGDEDDQGIDDLADQLADFRSFGASLRLSTTTLPSPGGGGAEVDTSSASTFIPLRT